MTDFKEGDRVIIKPEMADKFSSPWGERFTKGRRGTVKGLRSFGRALVAWDYKTPRVKYPSDWELLHDTFDLQLLSEEESHD